MENSFKFLNVGTDRARLVAEHVVTFPLVTEIEQKQTILKCAARCRGHVYRGNTHLAVRIKGQEVEPAKGCCILVLLSHWVM